MSCPSSRFQTKTIEPLWHGKKKAVLFITVLRQPFYLTIWDTSPHWRYAVWWIKAVIVELIRLGALNWEFNLWTDDHSSQDPIFRDMWYMADPFQMHAKGCFMSKTVPLIKMEVGFQCLSKPMGRFSQAILNSIFVRGTKTLPLAQNLGSALDSIALPFVLRDLLMLSGMAYAEWYSIKGIEIATGTEFRLELKNHVGSETSSLVAFLFCTVWVIKERKPGFNSQFLQIKRKDVTKLISVYDSIIIPLSFGTLFIHMRSWMAAQHSIL